MKALLLLALSCSVGGFVLAQSANKNVVPTPKFSELSREDKKRLDQQRKLVEDTTKQRYGTVLSRTKKDLPILQKLLDDKVFTKSQTFELQSLGIAFGDVLTSELPLRWVMIMDEYGTDPTLRFMDTDININALTMISKRVEGGELVDVSELVRLTRKQLSVAEKQSRLPGQ